MARLALMGAMVVSITCATTRRATLAQLQQRAVFDLDCPGDQLWLYPIDSRTKAVTGCRQRLVYVEQCDQLSNVCSWKIDMPTGAQWHRKHHGTAGSSPPQLGAAAGLPSSPSTTAPSRGRVIRTDLYGTDTGRTKARPLDPRNPPTRLFGGSNSTSLGSPAPHASTAPPPASTAPIKRKRLPGQQPPLEPTSSAAPPSTPPASLDHGF